MMRRCTASVVALVALLLCCGFVASTNAATVGDTVHVNLRSAVSPLHMAGGPHRLSANAGVLQQVKTVSALVSDETDPTAPEGTPDPRSAAELYGTILSGGVIGATTVVLVFACLVLLLVVIELVTNFTDCLENRRMRAAREARAGDDPAEPKYGDFRDTAVNVQV